MTINQIVWRLQEAIIHLYMIEINSNFQMIQSCYWYKAPNGLDIDGVIDALEEIVLHLQQSFDLEIIPYPAEYYDKD
jgi:hypothetical protein